MRKTQCCPACHEPAVSVQDRWECRCGWRDKNKQENRVPDLRCAYVLNEKRCPLPGTISPVIRGNGKRYCSGHFHALGDPQEGESILRAAEKNYQVIIRSRKPWQIDLGEALRGGEDK